MNKFGALVALAAGLLVMAHLSLAAPSHSQAVELKGEEEASSWGLIPSDNEEVEHLSEEHKVFSEFCIDSRDYVKNDFKEGVKQGIKFAAKSFFQTIGSFVGLVEEPEIDLDATRIACERTRSVGTQLRYRFEDFKRQVTDASAGAVDVMGVEFESVKCQTIQRILAVIESCRIV